MAVWIEGPEAISCLSATPVASQGGGKEITIHIMLTLIHASVCPSVHLLPQQLLTPHCLSLCRHPIPCLASLLLRSSSRASAPLASAARVHTRSRAPFTSCFPSLIVSHPFPASVLHSTDPHTDHREDRNGNLANGKEGKEQRQQRREQEKEKDRRRERQECNVGSGFHMDERARAAGTASRSSAREVIPRKLKFLH